jgi:hypothetical protein
VRLSSCTIQQQTWDTSYGQSTRLGTPLLNSLSILFHIIISRYYDITKPADFSVVAGILRLSTKYEVRYLRQRATQHLLSVYSATLDEWDQRKSGIIPSFSGRPLAVLCLAREVDIPILLPAAMYGCVTSALEILLDGATLHDGSHVELDWRDKRSCIVARSRLSDALLGRIFNFLLWPSPSGCSTAANCTIGRMKHLCRFQTRSLTMGGPRPLSKRFLKGFQDDVCGFCYSTAQTSFVGARRALWDDLPGIFGLPSWQELGAVMHADVESRTARVRFNSS